MNWLMRHQNTYSKKKKLQKLKQTNKQCHLIYRALLWQCGFDAGTPKAGCVQGALQLDYTPTSDPAFTLADLVTQNFCFLIIIFWTVELWGEGELELLINLHSIYQKCKKLSFNTQNHRRKIYPCIHVYSHVCVWSCHLDHLKKAILLTLLIALIHSK